MATPLETIRLTVGGLLAAAPDRAGRAVFGRSLEGRERLTVRVLGARHVAQALAARVPALRPWAEGPGIDMVHAASMIALGAASPRYRRAAMVSAGVAGALAVAAYGLRRGEPVLER